jgi:hypothetical protein
VRVTPDELKWHRDQERQRAERDAANLVAESRMARQRGFDEGGGKGTEEGIRMGRIQAFQQLLGPPEMPRTELSQLSEQALEQMEESSKRQLSGPKPANGSSPTGKTGTSSQSRRR